MAEKSHLDQAAEKRDSHSKQHESSELQPSPSFDTTAQHIQQDSAKAPPPSINTTVQHVRTNPRMVLPREVMQLQRAVGNRAVMRSLRSVSPTRSSQPAGATVQRQAEVNEVTPEEEQFNKEHGARKGKEEEAAGATVNNLGAPGPKCTAALLPNYWGYTIPEAIRPTLTATLAGGTWTASATAITGDYSIATRLLAGVTEVTGPGGNTLQANYSAQVSDLRALSPHWGSWFMLQAIRAHEAVHETKMAPSLNDTEVAIKALFAALSVPASATVTDAASAVTAIQALPAYATALTNAYNLWNARYFVLIAGDHNGTAGPSYDAERAVVNPMIAQINTFATAPAQHWGPAA